MKLECNIWFEQGVRMIRDFTKSAMSFSWALSLLGMKQAVNLVRPGQQRDGNLLAPMTQVAVDQLDESMKGIYRSGDNLQARAVDMAFTWMNPVNWMNPNSWLRPFAGGCGRQDGGMGQSGGGPTNPGFGQGSGGGSNGFTQAASGLGQAVSQATAGFSQAVGQATAGLAQAISGITSPGQPPGRPSAASPDNASVGNESAAAGWGPMPGDS